MRAGERRQAGFSYLLLLGWVAVSGVMLSALGTQWLAQGRREAEADLVFRAGQITRALHRYAMATPAGQPTAPLSLDALLDDTRSGARLRHLRQVGLDPITRGPWGLLKDGDRIVGIYSTSSARPWAAPEGVIHYRDWVFRTEGAVTGPYGTQGPANELRNR
jgi:hypothetical protein